MIYVASSWLTRQSQEKSDQYDSLVSALESCTAPESLGVWS
jgi:hypothetical protein